MRANGLLKKAQSLRGHAPRLRVLGPHELRADQDDAITAEERATVLAEIEEVVSGGRLKITRETFEFSARRRGGVLPALVNGVALLVIAGGVALAFYFSRKAEQNIVSPPVTILSAENKVLEAVKAEAQAQMSSKDREISAIRDQIAGFDAQKAKIQQDAAASLAQKQKELQDSYAAAVAAERTRLEASGLTEKEVNSRIAALDARNQAAMDAQLAAFQKQADTDRRQQENALAALQAESQSKLAQAQADRAKLQEDAASRQAALEAQASTLKQDTAAALAELARLRDQQAGQQLVLDQILSWYQKARDQVQAGKPDAALAVLSDFRAYLDSENVASLPAVASRRPVDLFLIDSLNELVRAQQSQASDTANLQNLVASANLISAVAALVQTGDQSFQAQSYDKARELYLSALARIPAVQAGYEKLGELDALAAEQRRKDVSTALTSANAAYRSGDLDTATTRYSQALALLQGDRAAADALVSQLEGIGSLRKAAEDAALLKGLQGDAAARARSEASIAALRARIAAAATTQAGSTRDTLVALLETKLLVQKLVLGADVVKKYPTLYDDLNRYFDALAAQSRADARLETLRDLDAMLGSAAGQGPLKDEVLQRYQPADQQALLLSVLDKLQVLVGASPASATAVPTEAPRP